MKQIGLLLSYFREPEVAQSALRILDRKGFRRRILLRGTADGRISRRDPSRRFRNTLILVGGLIISTISVTLSFIGVIPWFPDPSIWNHLLITTVGFGIGAGLGALLSATIFPVVSSSVIDPQANRLSNDESLLIIQAPVASLSRALRILRDSMETEHTIFALHPLRDFPEPPDLRDLVAMPLPQIKSHASSLAREHQVDYQGGSSR
jgi:hypothetical protein